MSFIQVEQQQFIFQGKPIRLRGFGIGTWLCLEHFMMGLPTSEKVMRQAFCQAAGEQTATLFFQNYQHNFIQEKDFVLLKECGVNFLRIPFNYRLFIDDNNSSTYRETGFQYFDHVLNLCEKYQIFVMFDLHTTPGSQNPDWHSDNDNGVPLFWEYQVFRRQVTKLWQAIAARYHDRTYVMGYDLLNEPAMANWPAINEFYEETIAAIREVDPHHVIVLEGDFFSMDFSGLQHFTDPQLALGFHYYPTVWHRDLLDPALPREVRKAKIAAGLAKLVAIQQEFDRPAFCGEFGYSHRDVGSEDFAFELLEDTIDLLEEHQLSWVVWCYKDAQVMSMVEPVSESSWMQLVDRIKASWSQDIEKEQAGQLLDVVSQWYPAMTDEERYLQQFRLRGNLYMLEKNHLLVPQLQAFSEEELLALPDAFRIENCRVNPRFKALMKSKLG